MARHATPAELSPICFKKDLLFESMTLRFFVVSTVFVSGLATNFDKMRYTSLRFFTNGRFDLGGKNCNLFLSVVIISMDWQII
jgi:hypothetical protein